MAAEVHFKTGVSPIAAAHPMIKALLPTAASVWGEFVEELWVTSLNDGNHRKKSFHYSDQAVDLRTRNLPSEAAKRSATRKLADLLGASLKRGLNDYWQPDQKGFRVLLETDHLHVEWRG